MADFFTYFLGTNALSFHVAGLLFSLFGALVAKYHFWQKHKSFEDKFDFNFWVKDNWLSVVISLLVSFMLVRFLDIFLLWVNPKVEEYFGFIIPQTDDEIFYYLISGVLIQVWMHNKYRKKKSE